MKPEVVRSVPVNAIVSKRTRIRRDLGDVAALADSIQEYGLLHPISVRADGKRFLLTVGERRLEAVKLLGWKEIPAFVRDLDTDRAYVVELIENLQRQDLSLEEEADGLIELLRTRGWSLEQVATSIKRSAAYVSKRVRVFEDPALRAAITKGGLPVSTAEELLALSLEQRADFAERALAERWDQPTARAAVQRLVDPPLPNEIVHGLHVVAEDDSRVVTLPSQVGIGRPTGFTQKVRDFHRMVMDVRPEDLTEADRSALRSLFRDLVMLARAPATPARPVFPPLPTSRTGRARSRAQGDA